MTTSSSAEAAELVQQWPALSSLRGWHHCFHTQSRLYNEAGPLAQAAVPAEGRRTVVIEMDSEEDSDLMNNMTPKEVVEHLDRNIVGQVGRYWVVKDMLSTCQPPSHKMFTLQADAKKAVANALRNRWRRHKIASPLKVCN